MDVCISLFTGNQTDPFLHRIVTCDEKWMLRDNGRRIPHWRNVETPKHIPKPNLHPRNITVTERWSAAGIFHYSFLKVGETINTDGCCLELQRMRIKLCEKPASVNVHGVLLLHNNAKSRVSRTTLRKLHELRYEVLHSLYFSQYRNFEHLNHFSWKRIQLCTGKCNRRLRFV